MRSGVIWVWAGRFGKIGLRPRISGDWHTRRRVALRGITLTLLQKLRSTNLSLSHLYPSSPPATHPMTVHTTKEGYRYDPTTGLETGFATEGAIRPTQYSAGKDRLQYDTIIVGAGYTGLIAARDLAHAGESIHGRIDR